MQQPQEQVIQVGELEMRFFVNGTHTGGHLAVAEMVVPPAARTPPPHAHANIDETVVGIAGTLTYMVDDVEYEVTPGARIFSPRGKPHGFWNRTDEPARVLLMFSPAHIGPEYFLEIGEVVNRGGPPDFQRLLGVMTKYGLTLAVPPPP